LESKNFDSFLVLNNLHTSTYGVGNFSFSSGLNGNPYFDIPFYEVDIWKQVTLYTPVLSIVASPSSSLTFDILDNPRICFNPFKIKPITFFFRYCSKTKRKI
jgi:hypothetical protein